ncbi:hypothetical protein B0J14DRAFT_585698 [Halenospora varia]|nr:hypothetical protein B0J14DRAFT_585698 [Halenospora varia]
MSFGFSVGDFIAVGKIVLKLYNDCQNAPREFQEINGELSSIHTVLFGLAEQARDPTSLLLRRGGDRGSEWIQIRKNLESTLSELQDLVRRYQTMGRSAWRRVKLGSENLNGLRSKLDFHLSVINTFVGSLSLSALGRMEPVLGRIETLLRESVREERAGHKTPTVLTAHETNDMVSWKQVEMDLLLEGIPREDFERNRERIKELLNWIVSNECDLASLRDVEPDDSVSCVVTTTNPFSTPVFELHSSAASIIDENFGPPSNPDREMDALINAIHQRNDHLSQTEFDFDQVFGLSSFEQEVENAFYLTTGRGRDFDDVWKSLDLEPSQPNQLKQVPQGHNTTIYGHRYFSPLAADNMSNVAELYPQDEYFQYPSSQLREVQISYVDNDHQASDNASTIGPQIFWRDSDLSTVEYQDYMMADERDFYSDFEVDSVHSSSYSDTETMVDEGSVHSDSDVSTSDGIEIVAPVVSHDEENNNSENEEINKNLETIRRMTGWIPLDG